MRVRVDAVQDEPRQNMNPKLLEPDEKTEAAGNHHVQKGQTDVRLHGRRDDGVP